MIILKFIHTILISFNKAHLPLKDRSRQGNPKEILIGDQRNNY